MITIWGIVSADDTVAASSGYTVRKDSDPGIYDITFDTAFTGWPAVLATQLYPNQPDSNGGDTRDNAVVVWTDKTYCRVVTGRTTANTSTAISPSWRSPTESGARLPQPHRGGSRARPEPDLFLDVLWGADPRA